MQEAEKSPETELSPEELTLIEKVRAGKNMQDVSKLVKGMPQNRRQEVLRSPEMRLAATELLVRQLRENRIEAGLMALGSLGFSAEERASQELQEAGAMGCMNALRTGSLTGMKMIKEAYGLGDELLATPEAAESAKAGLAYLGSRKSFPDELVAKYRAAMETAGLSHLLE